jgi:hypothetical protein
MEPIEIELKIEELRSAIDELFSQLYWVDTDDTDMYNADIETLEVKDSLDFLEDECRTQINQIKELVEQMIKVSRDLLPGIMYKIDQQLAELATCLKSIATTDTTDKSIAEETNIKEATNIKIDVNNIIKLSKIDTNNLDVNKINL